MRKGARNPLAYPFALLSVGSPAGGAVNFFIMIFIIGLLAAMAIPAFEKVRETSQTHACINNLRLLESSFEQFQLENGKVPESFDDLIGPDRFLIEEPFCLLGGDYNIEIDTNGYPVGTCTVHGTVETALDFDRVTYE